MCGTPNLLPDGTLVACRDCRQCRDNRVNDWVGRCIAESRTAKAASVVTFTYGGGDHERAAVLTYSDMQKCFKIFRKRGYPLKYFAVGEYGSVKGRTHWHVIIYWLEKVYPHIDCDGNAQGDFGQIAARPLYKRWDGTERMFSPPHVSRPDQPYRYFDTVWPHGHMVWDKPDVKAIKYACKYLNKDVGGAEKQFHMAMSKKPPLGHEYFQQLAGQSVAAGLSPQDLFYEFDEARNTDGKKTRFMMQSVTAKNFLDGFISQWERRYGNDRWPYSDLVQDHIDAQVEPWRLPEKLERAAQRMREREATPEVMAELDDREGYDRQHRRYYFGEYDEGLYNTEWKSGEEEGRQEEYEDGTLFQPPQGVVL